MNNNFNWTIWLWVIALIYIVFGIWVYWTLFK